MAGTSSRWTRLAHAADAASLAYLLVLGMAFVTERASAFEALGVVFAVPIYLAGIVCVARWTRIATGGGPTVRPRPHLGRPSWERPGDERRSATRAGGA
jgi:hypothetical protein